MVQVLSWRFAFLLLAAAFFPHHANSQALSASSLNGSYGFRFQGNIVLLQTIDTGAAPLLVPFAGAGVFTADGTGHISSGSISYDYQGQQCTTSIVRGPSVNGPDYTVSADGEGGLTLTLVPQQFPCALKDLLLFMALDDLDAADVARHVELLNVEADGTIQVNASNNPPAYVTTATGEARFQRPRPGVRPCVLTDRC
jgi:hypothetical protein